MTAEWLTAWATLGTFVVIAASAAAALIQLRHMRSSNQITVLTEIRETLESAEFQDAVHYTSYEFPAHFEDPATRARMLHRQAFSNEFSRVRMVGNFFETIGAFVRTGILDRDLACDLWHVTVSRNWNAMEPFITNIRSQTGDMDLFENFEYLAALSARWARQHPHGHYPSNTERMPQSAIWPETNSE